MSNSFTKQILKVSYSALVLHVLTAITSICMLVKFQIYDSLDNFCFFVNCFIISKHGEVSKIYSQWRTQDFWMLRWLKLWADNLYQYL